MPTLIVGLAVVALSTIGFAVAMFGRRPLPQPATAAPATAPAPVATVSEAPAGRPVRRGTLRRSDDVSAHDVPRLQVEVPGPVRIRSAFILALGVLAVAAVAGVLLSVVVVGFFTVIG